MAKKMGIITLTKPSEQCHSVAGQAGAIDLDKEIKVSGREIVRAMKAAILEYLGASREDGSYVAEFEASRISISGVERLLEMLDIEALH
jgi:hypothetical protein